MKSLCEKMEFQKIRTQGFPPASLCINRNIKNHFLNLVEFSLYLSMLVMYTKVFQYYGAGQRQNSSLPTLIAYIEKI